MVLYLDKAARQRRVLHEVHGWLAEDSGGVDDVRAARERGQHDRIK